ncbi:MAG: type VI secretion system baseplate subunit TssG [Siculibacillus sp.]|nr:type VI secretion system baseplate subunit TssG [Siculibacillus sp.]
MTIEEMISADPAGTDWFNLMRLIERSHPEAPRIGDAAAIREEYTRLGQNPFFVFPASNVESHERDAAGRHRVLVRFLGLLGPQGALPLAVTDEAHSWLLMRDQAFARFCDLFNNRFLQLFYRAWADARPIAQNERPDADRFHAYIGSAIGLGSPPFRDLDSVPDDLKLAHAGLAAPAAKSAVRLEALFLGVLGLEAEVEEFVGSRLPVAEADRTRIGLANAMLGDDVMLGSTFYSVTDKIRVHVKARSLAEYERVLPVGDYADRIADLVHFYLGAMIEWDLVPSIPAAEATPIRLGASGRLGWTTWLSPRRDVAPGERRADARFDLASGREIRDRRRHAQ